MSHPHLLSSVALQHALKDGHYGKAIKALKAGQDVNAPLPQGHSKPSPLAEMWRWEKPARASEVMALLLQAGADPNAPDIVGRRPLHTWLWLTEAPKEAVQSLIKAGANPLYKSIITPQKTQQSALQVCVFRGLTEKLEWIVEAIPDIGSRHDEHWEEPIMRNAIQNTRDDTPDNRRMLLILLGCGASIDTVDKFGRSGRSEMMGYQVEMVNQWEEIVRADQEGQQLQQATPHGTGLPGLRRM